MPSAPRSYKLHFTYVEIPPKPGSSSTSAASSSHSAASIVTVHTNKDEDEQMFDEINNVIAESNRLQLSGNQSGENTVASSTSHSMETSYEEGTTESSLTSDSMEVIDEESEEGDEEEVDEKDEDALPTWEDVAREMGYGGKEKRRGEKRKAGGSSIRMPSPKRAQKVWAERIEGLERACEV